MRTRRAAALLALALAGCPEQLPPAQRGIPPDRLPPAEPIAPPRTSRARPPEADPAPEGAAAPSADAASAPPSSAPLRGGE